MKGCLEMNFIFFFGAKIESGASRKIKGYLLRIAHWGKIKNFVHKFTIVTFVKNEIENEIFCEKLASKM